MTHIGNLGSFLETIGRYDEAEPLYTQVLAMRRAALPEGHPDIGRSLHNLAYLNVQLGRFDTAESLYREALEIGQAALPAGHPSIAKTMNSLAGVLESLAGYVEAEALYRESIALSEAALPEGHPDIALGLNNLAYLFYVTARYEEAEALYRKVLAIEEAAFGEDHPRIAQTLGNLASLLSDIGQEGEAERLYREALRIRRAALPEGHPDIGRVIGNLGVLYFHLRPGNTSLSYLLLGDGSTLALDRLDAGNFRFGNVDLVTLSACNTAVGDVNAHGQEVEGMAKVVQTKGAKAVIATLWPVADESTGRFMQHMYRLRMEGGLTKAEALRQTQLAFLRGEVNVSNGNRRRRKPVSWGEDAHPVEPLEVDPDRPYAHPYTSA